MCSYVRPIGVKRKEKTPLHNKHDKDPTVQGTKDSRFHESQT